MLLCGVNAKVLQRKKESESAVQTHCRGHAKKWLEYLLWAAWFSALAFWIKMGRLKHFPGISWWLHCRQGHFGCQTNLCTWPDTDVDVRSCSLFLCLPLWRILRDNSLFSCWNWNIDHIQINQSGKKLPKPPVWNTDFYRSLLVEKEGVNNMPDPNG